MLLTGVHHVQLTAPPGCETEARAFWGELLGLPELVKPINLQPRGGVWFQCGDQQLHVSVETDFRPSKKGHPAILVANLRELRQHFEAHGVPTNDDEPLPGFQRFYASDPFGNRLEFLQPDASVSDSSAGFRIIQV